MNRWTLSIVAAGALAAPLDDPRAQEGRIDAAELTADGELVLPAGIDEWIVLGASIGGDYGPGEFDPDAPGPIGVVQIEPEAYRHLLEHGRYADGTMLLLSFYPPAPKPEPALAGFTQGQLALREIHLIDRERYDEERAFFQFPAGGARTAAPLPPGSECVRCHAEHGRLDATFAQFYPPVRHLVDGAAE